MSPRIAAARTVLFGWLMLGSLACRSDPPRAVIPALDAGDAAGRDAGEERTPDAAPDVGPPLTVPGLALWLDPRVGLEVSAGAVTSWTDRSPYRHRLVAEAPDMETRPAPAPLAGRPAVGFAGRSRIYVDAPAGEARQALTIENEDFLLAIVFQSNHPEERGLLFAALPRLDDINAPSPDPYSLLVEFGSWPDATRPPSLQIAAGNRFSIEKAAPFDRRAPGLLLIESIGTRLRIRVNGQLRVDEPLGRLAEKQAGNPPTPLHYQPIFVGGWDWDIRGLDGALGDVVLVKGAGVAEASPRIEAHLLAKYGLGP